MQICKGLLKSVFFLLTAPAWYNQRMVERLSGCNSEREFQNLIVDLAHANGWKIFHLYHSVRGGGGFPDLTLVHPTTRRLVYAELKLNHKSVRPIQREWLDTLRCLKAGWCTMLFHIFLMQKTATMRLPGGNTESLYQGDGRYQMAKSLQEQHPDCVRISYKWGRYQHHVNYKPFANNPLRLRPGVEPLVLAPPRLGHDGNEKSAERYKQILERINER